MLLPPGRGFTWRPDAERFTPCTIPPGHTVDRCFTGRVGARPECLRRANAASSDGRSHRYPFPFLTIATASESGGTARHAAR